MTSRSRANNIREQLDWLQREGVITDWQKASPQGIRWSLSSNRGLNIVLSTREVEAWISGALTAYTPSLHNGDRTRGGEE